MILFEKILGDDFEYTFTVVDKNGDAVNLNLLVDLVINYFNYSSCLSNYI